VDADGNPFMSTHGIWLGSEFVGRIFRVYPNTPWIYCLRGAPTDRTGCDDFNACVVKLLAWRDRYIADLEQLFSDTTQLASWIEKAKADDRAERTAQLALAKAEEAKEIKARKNRT
jgi:hypothetical protein